MSRKLRPGAGDDEQYAARPGDDLVEPLFGALRSGEADRDEEPEEGPSSPGLLARLRGLLPRRSPAEDRDWFACPVCGSEVPAGARSCRECGSDEETGWSPATAYDDLDLPEQDGPRVPDTFEEFTRATSPRRGPPQRLLLTLLVVALAMILARAAASIFAG